MRAVMAVVVVGMGFCGGCSGGGSEGSSSSSSGSSCNSGETPCADQCCAAGGGLFRQQHNGHADMPGDLRHKYQLPGYYTLL